MRSHRSPLQAFPIAQPDAQDARGCPDIGSGLRQIDTVLLQGASSQDDVVILILHEQHGDRVAHYWSNARDAGF